MSHSAEPPSRRVLVIGSQGVLGRLLCDAFAGDGWSVLRGGRRPDGCRTGFRHVDLDEPETLSSAIAGVDLVINPVPDLALTAERTVLERGGLLLNVSAMPGKPGQRLAEQATRVRGTVVMNCGIAPGVTNLVAAELLGSHPEADELELCFTVSTKSTSGRAGGDFAHRNLTALARHRTTVIPLPEPFGRRRCLGFAETDAGWLSGSIANVRVSPYVCIAERAAQRAMLALNSAGVISKVPRGTFRPAREKDEEATSEPIAHWIAVRRNKQLIAARTVECRGDYRAAAQSAVVFANALARTKNPPAGAGVFGPEDLLSLEEVKPALGDAGIAVRDQAGIVRHGSPRASTREHANRPVYR